jgi:hypothetical protein
MTQAIEAKVDELLAQAGVRFDVRYVGRIKKDGGVGSKPWDCDQWAITLSKGTVVWNTSYYTGLGLRKAMRPGADGLRVERKNPEPRNTNDWHRWNEAHLKPIKPTAASLMYSLLLDGSALDESFPNWCGNFGYSTDSLKALNTYNECCAIGQQLRLLFTYAQRADLLLALQDY